MADQEQKIESLRHMKEKIEAGIQQLEAARDRLKGELGPGASKKRQVITRKEAQLRASKEKIEAELKQLEDSPSDTKKLEQMIRELQSSIDARKESINKQIELIREKQEHVIGDNSLLAGVLAKEKLKMKMRFNREVIASIDNKEQIQEISDRNERFRKRLEKAEDEFEKAMDEISVKFDNDPVAKMAKDHAETEIKEQDKVTAATSGLREKLADADSDEARKKIEARIEDIEEDGASEEEKRISANIKNATEALEQLKGKKGKEAVSSREMAQGLLDSYRNQLETIRKKKSKKDEPPAKDA